MSDPIVIDDDEEFGELGEDDESGPDVGAGDGAPQHDEGTTRFCPECDRKFTGLFSLRSLNVHRSRAHPEEWAASKGEEPAPAPRQDSTRSDRAPRDGRRLPRQLQEVHDNVVLYYRLGGSAIGFRDPVCGGAVAHSAEAAASAWVSLAKENEKVRAFWSGGGGSVAWLGLFMAHLPVLEAIRQHHINPAMERRQAAREAALYAEEFGEPDEGEPVVYATGAPTPEDPGSVYE